MWFRKSNTSKQNPSSTSAEKETLQPIIEVEIAEHAKDASEITPAIPASAAEVHCTPQSASETLSSAPVYNTSQWFSRFPQIHPRDLPQRLSYYLDIERDASCEWDLESRVTLDTRKETNVIASFFRRNKKHHIAPITRHQGYPLGKIIAAGIFMLLLVLGSVAGLVTEIVQVVNHKNGYSNTHRFA